MRAFLETGIGGHSKAVYVSFSHSPVTMKKKVGGLFDEPRFPWVDCCADGKGRGAAQPAGT